jgi:dual specificity MAP kinase phosphatase
LEEAFEFIETAKNNNAKILVHCQLGKSRSSSILIAYFIKYLGYEWDSAYTFLKNKRKIVFPNLSFMNELKLYSKTVRESDKLVNK